MNAIESLVQINNAKRRTVSKYFVRNGLLGYQTNVQLISLQITRAGKLCTNTDEIN